MANSKITDYTALTGANVDTAADLLEIVDFSSLTNKKIVIDELRIALMSNSALTNSLGSDVALNNASNYFTGPTCAQGTSGTWFASGTVTITDSAGGATVDVKLWDGTTVIASCEHRVPSITAGSSIAISGFIASPAGNIRISCKSGSTTSSIVFNVSGNSKDSTLSVFRIG